MITANAATGHTILLGREGENLARSMIFDIADWISAYGVGTVSLIAQRNGDDEPYPCTVTVDGSAVTWLVTAADTARKGYGKCELRYAVGDVLVKSETWLTYTADALGTPAPEAPEPQKAWVDKVLAAGQAAVDASVNSPKVGDNGNWFVWDFEAGKYVDTGVAASGGGSSLPTTGVEDAGKVLTVTEAGVPGWMLPSQGDWKTLVDVTTEEDASRFTFQFDDVSELIIMISGTATSQRIDFFSDGITNFYHYKFLKASQKTSNYLHVHKRIGGMRYMESGDVSLDTPETGFSYALIHSQAYGMIVRSVKDSINNLRFDVNSSDILQSGARIQIFGR